MTEELILKPFERLSVSKLDNAEMCLRHYYFQHVLGIEETATDARQKRLDAGNLFDEQVEAYVKGKLKEVSGAVAAVARHYPTPGQSCVDAQRWTRATWAGAPWVGKIDLLTGPSTIWGPLNRAQKNGMIRVTDLKVAGSLKWAKTAEQIDRNRQLHMYATGIYRERQKEIPKLFEVSQVVVERNAPHRCQSIVRVSGRDQALELEQEDAPLVKSVVACHGEADVMNFPRAETSQCERWYGDRCPYFERCYGSGRVSVASSLGALMDAEAGKGSAGAGRTIDEIAAGTAPAATRNFAGDEAEEECPTWVRTHETRGKFETLWTEDDARPPGAESLSEAYKRLTQRNFFKDEALGEWDGGDVVYRKMRDGIITVASYPGNSEIYREKENMLSTPDAAKAANAKIEGENARYRPRTVVQGKSYVAIQGDRHGRTWEFRMLGDSWIIRVADKPGPVEATPGFYPVDTTDESAKGSVPTGTGAKMDIVQLRALFSPFLLAWDEREAPKKELPAAGEQHLEEDDIFGQAEKQITEQSGVKAPSEDRVKELTSVGLTDAQARSLADGGVTLEALRAGTVTVADLTRCKGIGKGGAEKVLARFEKSGVKAPSSSGKEQEKGEKLVKDEAAKDQEKIEQFPQVRDGEIIGSAVAKHAVDRIAELEAKIAIVENGWQARFDAERAEVKRLRDEQGKPKGFTVFVDCRPMTGEVFEFHNLLRSYLNCVAQAKNVRDVGMVEPGYLVAGLLNEALHADPPAPCAFVVSSSDYHWKMVRRYFLSRSSEVVVASVVP